VTAELVAATRILSIAAVVAAVGDRVYVQKVPQKPTLPYIRVQRISGVRDQQLKGPDGLTISRVQVDAVGTDAGVEPYPSVADLAAAIRGDGLGPNASGLWGWIGTAGGSPDAARVFNVQFADEGVDYEGDEFRTIRMRQDFLLHWREID
jgi:uncharacterized protein DUF3168